jgi:beta-lactamase class A
MKQLLNWCFVWLNLLLMHSALSQPKRLVDYLETLPPDVKVNAQVERLSSGKVLFSQGADERLAAASLIKVPIMVELMEQVRMDKLTMESTLVLRDANKVSGGGTIANYPDGAVIRIKELARQMIVYSDNTATNLLIAKLGQASINARMKALGLPGLQLNRVMMDTAAAKRGQENYVTAYQINQLLRLIQREEVATPALCRLALEFLLQNDDRSTLPRHLPEDVAIAHKTGELAYIRSDAGIVFAKKPYIISVFVRGTTTEKAEEIIAEIGRIVMSYEL